jgi:hypothetical protein
VLTSIEKAREALPNLAFLFAAFSAMAMAVFIATMFRSVATRDLLVFVGIGACVGLLLGSYWKYRWDCGTAGIFFFQSYFFLTTEYIFAGSAAGVAPFIAGRPDLCWFAFFTNAFCMVISLLGGMYLEAKAIGWFGGRTADQWKAALEKHIDYSKHQVIPADEVVAASADDKWNRYGLLLIGAGSANIPLLFELFGGGRFNAIFLAVPLLTGTFAYINLKNLGPAVLRIMLLRKLEISLGGRRFVNADLEKIQELRRSFFLSRWLMKDFVKPQPAKPAARAFKPQKHGK